MECRLLHFCTDDYILILRGFSSCTFLYGWLPSHFEWIFVIYISVRMTTISFWMDCRHVHFCTNDYHFFLERIVVMHVSVRKTTISFRMDFRHARFVQMTLHTLYLDFRHALSVRMTFHIILVFPCVQCSSTDE